MGGLVSFPDLSGTKGLTGAPKHVPDLYKTNRKKQRAAYKYTTFSFSISPIFILSRPRKGLDTQALFQVTVLFGLLLLMALLI